MTAPDPSKETSPDPSKGGEFGVGTELKEQRKPRSNKKVVPCFMVFIHKTLKNHFFLKFFIFLARVTSIDTQCYGVSGF